MRHLYADSISLRTHDQRTECSSLCLIRTPASSLIVAPWKEHGKNALSSQATDAQRALSQTPAASPAMWEAPSGWRAPMPRGLGSRAATSRVISAVRHSLHGRGSSDSPPPPTTTTNLAKVPLHRSRQVTTGPLVSGCLSTPFFGRDCHRSPERSHPAGYSYTRCSAWLPLSPRSRMPVAATAISTRLRSICRGVVEVCW